jgi:hypothetical protein
MTLPQATRDPPARDHVTPSGVSVAQLQRTFLGRARGSSVVAGSDDPDHRFGASA